MITSISSNSDSLETASVNNYVLLCLGSLSIELSPYFTELIAQVKSDGEILNEGIHLEKRDDFTIELAEKDKQFNRQFRCMKAFVEANELCSDPVVASASRNIARTLELNNPDIPKMGYEKQITAGEILLEDLNKEDNKALIAKLVGVAEEVQRFAQVEQELRQLLVDRHEARALKDKVTPSYIQRKIVRDLLNSEVLPLISVKGKEDSENFEEIVTKIDQFIVEMNASIRLRYSKRSQSDDENIDETTNDISSEDEPEE